MHIFRRKKRWYKPLNSLALLVLLALSLLSWQPSLADQKLPESVKTVLTAPISIANCTDGQFFELKIVQDESSKPLAENARLRGHLRIVTPDSRATKNQFVELIVDSLTVRRASYPVTANFRISGNALISKSGTETSKIPIERYHQGNDMLGAFISQCAPISISERRKNERLALKKKAAMKLNDIKDRRYGLEREGQMVFLSTKSNPFNLPAGEPFVVNFTAQHDDERIILQKLDEISVLLNDALDSEEVHKEKYSFKTTLQHDVIVDGKLFLPANTIIVGNVFPEATSRVASRLILNFTQAILPSGEKKEVHLLPRVRGGVLHVFRFDKQIDLDCTICSVDGLPKVMLLAKKGHKIQLAVDDKIILELRQ